MSMSPESSMISGNRFVIGQRKTPAFTATGCSTSGSTLTIGTLTSGTVAVGQLISSSTGGPSNNQYIISGSGSTWTLSNSVGTLSGLTITGYPAFIGAPTAATSLDALKDLRLITNTVKGSGGTTQIVTSSAGATLELRGNNIQLENAAGTSIVGSGITYNRVYLQAEYNTTVTPAAANTAYVFPIGTATFSNIASIGSTSRIILGAAGTYNLQFSVQVSNANSQEHTAYIWLRKNGVDIANSTGRVTVVRQGSTITGWNFMINSANTTDYYEIAYAVDDVNVTFPAFGSTAFAPGTASLVTTITPVGA
jgi:hypothetical protein